MTARGSVLQRQKKSAVFDAAERDIRFTKSATSFADASVLTDGNAPGRERRIGPGPVRIALMLYGLLFLSRSDTGGN